MVTHRNAADPLADPSLPAVLLVNDRANQRVAIRSMLTSLSVEVVEADSGRAALRAVLQQTFALILMDVRMPIMDGYETANLIRAAAGVEPDADHLRHCSWA